MPKCQPFAIWFSAFAVLMITAAPLPAQSPERATATVNESSVVLDEIMRIPARGIPRSLLSKAEGVVIVPGMVKGGFVVGVRHGRGVVLIRDKKGDWSLPRMVEMTGGSVGFQIGVQSIDVILVFMTRRSVDGLLGGKFTIGADASAAAGPVGRTLAAATDERLEAEILSYSRSRGLFAGVSLEGSTIELDIPAEWAFYGPPEDGQYTKVPEAAVRLVQKITQYSGSGSGPASPKDAKEEPKAASTPPEAARKQLAEAATQLSAMLPEDWRRYLALPPEVYGSEEHPSVDSLKRSLSRFDRVAEDAQYRTLTERDEFQKTHTRLRQYLTTLVSASSEQLPLPPPPKN